MKLFMKKAGVLLALISTVLLCSFADPEWIVFLSHDGTFKISFPHEPEVLKHVVDSGLVPLKSRLIKYDVGKYKDANQSYQLIYSDYCDTIVNSDFKTRISDTFLKDVIFDIRDEIKGRIVSIEPLMYKDEYPGRHVHMTFDGKNALNMKMYLIKSRLYIIRVICDITNDNNPEIEKFFESFELVDAPAKKAKKSKK
jgi:hypothetical protein